ncbi:3-methylcrotonyl-CoA carboxylase [Methylobacterium variabile]|jgi:geranyl-CoA carboxylase alpha subunit|uniref:3-methylcrotonyl-CoA carboxylase n=1 Tax=Methylobacterium variabile TaxID=298794 RepID=A0A0J6T363_9HYPH|nr:biotin carboxylase N-terminal domain-containing protein [Methylobacterium variabile]KMO40399.1 3-methylcrotonyl-CoA carboxylase [Methylobacterium variabile]
MTFSTLLIANRGEIACRIIRTARAQGYRTVAVYSTADADARHVREADIAVPIGPAPARESYLCAEAIVAAAVRAGADAVHPGYGFLSENAEFAEACEAAGLTWIGPPPASIRAMGDKASAKRLMREAGVPCVPGYDGEDDRDATLAAEAEAIGYPVMVKASAGGGGRGMRLVHAASDLPEALAGARAEAQAAFGSGRLLLERAVVGARHVEIQVFADRHGAVIHLGERDCSVQRRHQKIIEEAPSPAVDAALRARMGAAAVRAAQAIGYVGAGTVEFLLDRSGDFFFLEMNTRLQVEHPVTEMVTGLDLVALQLDAAQGLPLPLGQDEVRLDGHAIEVRLYAEDPAAGFLPQTGLVRLWRPAPPEMARVDHGLREGAAVTPYYDPMLAKVIAWGRDREEARRRLMRAVEATVVLGVTTNKAYLLAALDWPDFAAGASTTDSVAVNAARDATMSAGATPALAWALGAALLAGGAPGTGPAWRATSLCLARGEEEVRVGLARSGEGWRITLPGDQPGRPHEIAVLAWSGGRVSYAADGLLRHAFAERSGDRLDLDLGGGGLTLLDRTRAPAAEQGAAQGGAVRAPMNGTLTAVSVAAGDRVERGQLLATIEAMKMEMRVAAPLSGTVSAVPARAGAAVAARQVLVTITPEATP